MPQVADAGTISAFIRKIMTLVQTNELSSSYHVLRRDNFSTSMEK